MKKLYHKNFKTILKRIKILKKGLKKAFFMNLKKIY